MTTRNYALRPLALLAGATLTFGGFASTAFGQSGDAIRAELQQVRAAYEARIAELERRLTTLEKETNEALDEIYSPAFFEEGLPKDVTRRFTLNGYIRAGYGFNSEGGGIEEFVIPDGLFEIGWRLGNEKDTYGEMTATYLFPVNDTGATFKYVNTLAFKYSQDKTNYTGDDDNGADILFREMYIEAANVVKSMPDTKFWAGQRFYKRHDIHINDFYFLDMSGYGGGIDNWDVGAGKLAIAFLGGTKDGVTVNNQGSLTEQHIDIRLEEIDMFGGKGQFWLDINKVNGGNNVNPNDVWGAAVGFIHFKPLEKGFNKFSIMYGYGPASDFNTYIADWKPKEALEESRRILLTNQTVWQFSDQFSVMGALVIDHDDLGWDPTGPGNESDSTRLLVSAGVRPIYMLAENYGIQAEIGVDYVDDVRWSAEDDGGYLGKITIAPTIKASGAFWARPEIRVFASYFRWSDDIPNWFGGAGVKSDENSAFQFGIQAEAWW